MRRHPAVQAQVLAWRRGGETLTASQNCAKEEKKHCRVTRSVSEGSTYGGASHALGRSSSLCWQFQGRAHYLTDSWQSQTLDPLLFKLCYRLILPVAPFPLAWKHNLFEMLQLSLKAFLPHCQKYTQGWRLYNFIFSVFMKYFCLSPQKHTHGFQVLRFTQIESNQNNQRKFGKHCHFIV